MTLTVVLIVVAVLIAAVAGYFLYFAPRRRAIPPTTPVQPEVSPPPKPPPVEAPEEQRADDRAAVAVEAPETVTDEEISTPTEVDEATVEAVEVAEAPVEVEAEPVEVAIEAPPRFRDRLSRARSLLGGYLTSVRARDRIDESTWEELEECLILADVGAQATTELLEDLRSKARKGGTIETPDELVDALKEDLKERLAGDTELHVDPDATTVWLFVGVNGVGKTTTIGKLGMREVRAGHSVVMAAGDTFRAAAADQLEMWSDRVGASVVRGGEGADPGSVVFDAVQHAAARKADLVLADTAGRLHTKTNLMEELKKVRRVAERPPGSVTEVLLVIDATTGQNGLVQARQFASAVGVTGVVLTKLDGTAKGGIVVAIRCELGIPIKQVGLGEGPEDLVEFDADEFVEALLGAPD